MKTKLVVKLLISGLALGTMFGVAEYAPTKVDAQVEPLLLGNSQQFGRLGTYMGQYFQGDIHDLIAQKLEMTSEELFDARLEGKSIATLLEEHKLDVEKVIDEIVLDRKKELDQLVEDKAITEVQKKYMLAQMELRIEATINADNVGPSYYRRGGCFMYPDFQRGMGRGRMFSPGW